MGFHSGNATGERNVKFSKHLCNPGVPNHHELGWGPTAGSKHPCLKDLVHCHPNNAGFCPVGFFLGGVTLGSLWVSIIIARCYCVIYKAIHILPILVESCFYLPQLKLSLFFAANMTCFPWTHASRSDLPSTASGKACAFVDCSSPWKDHAGMV